MASFLIDYENVTSDGLAGIELLGRDDETVIFYSDKADKITFDIYEKMKKSKSEITMRKVNVGSKNALDFQLASYLGYLIGMNNSDIYFVISKDQGFSVLKDFWEEANILFMPDISSAIDYLKRTDTESVQVGKNTAAYTNNAPVNNDISNNSLSLELTQVLKSTVTVSTELTSIVKLVDTVNSSQMDRCTGCRKVSDYLKENYASEKAKTIYNLVKVFIKDEKTVPNSEMARVLKNVAASGTEIAQIIEIVNTSKANVNKSHKCQAVNNALCKKYGSEKAGKIYKLVKPYIKGEEITSNPEMARVLKKAVTSSTEIEQIVKLVNTDPKNVHDILGKKYKEKGSEIYKLIKPYINKQPS
ncbi:MAG: hypothetical protein J1F64_04155 [Oscillospiraceae bacterium]|nr:hypothetical protein [Oscillospiraceae bacterium]